LAFLLQPWHFSLLQSHTAENWRIGCFGHGTQLLLLAFLAHCFKGCFGLGTKSQEAKKKRERLGARCQELFLLDPADPSKGSWLDLQESPGALDAKLAVQLDLVENLLHMV